MTEPMAPGARLSAMNKRRSVRRVPGALAAGSLVLGLTACGSTVGGPGASGASGICGQARQVTALSVEHARQGPLARKHQQEFEFPAKKIMDPAAARSVAEAVCGLPVMSSRAIVCPIDTGATYRLVFSVDARKLPAVAADPAGCQEVKGAGRPRTAVRSPGLWRALAEAER